MKTKLSLPWQKIGAAELGRPSVIFLLLANMVPLYGIFFLHWDIFPLLVLFWMENVIVGVFNVFKMLIASPSRAASWPAKAAAIPFFCVHYGLFTFVHGIFVFALFGGVFEEDFTGIVSLTQVIWNYQMGWAALALFVSHLVSFAVNYVGKGEYKQTSLNELMGAPYARVVVLHITIVLGGFLIGFLGSPAVALLLLMVLKTFIDVIAHLRQHGKFRSSQTETGIPSAPGQ
jgi:hypothetical protein